MSDQEPTGCTVCDHPLRSDIEKALEVPRSERKTSTKFDVSRAVLRRHRAQHMHKHALELPKDLNSNEILALKATAQRIVDETDDDKVRIAALRELRGYLELEARLQQESGGSASLTTQPAFQALAAAMASCLCAECHSRIASLTEDAIGTALSHTKAAEEEGGVPAPDEEGGGGGILSPNSDTV